MFNFTKILLLLSITMSACLLQFHTYAEEGKNNIEPIEAQRALLELIQRGVFPKNIKTNLPEILEILTSKNELTELSSSIHTVGTLSNIGKWTYDHSRQTCVRAFKLKDTKVTVVIDFVRKDGVVQAKFSSFQLPDKNDYRK